MVQHYGDDESDGECNKHVLYTQSNIIMLYSHYQQRKHFFIKIYLSFYSRKGAQCLLLVWEIDEETYTQRGDSFLFHIFFRDPGGTNACTPCKPFRLRRPNPLLGCMSLARLPILCPVSIWPRGYHVVSFRLHTCWTQLLWRAGILLFTNHNVTACQSTRGY